MCKIIITKQIREVTPNRSKDSNLFIQDVYLEEIYVTTDCSFEIFTNSATMNLPWLIEKTKSMIYHQLSTQTNILNASLKKTNKPATSFATRTLVVLIVGKHKKPESENASMVWGRHQEDDQKFVLCFIFDHKRQVFISLLNHTFLLTKNRKK